MKFKVFLNRQWKASGLKKGDFANKIGITRQLFRSYLSGKTSPSFDQAVEISKKLKCTVQIINQYTDDELFDVVSN